MQLRTIPYEARRNLLCTLLLLLFTGLLFAMVGCQSQKAPPSPIPVTPPAAQVASLPAPQFLGDAACRPCHPAIAHDQEGTNHAKTLRVANKEGLGSQYPKAGEASGFEYRVTEDKEGLSLALKESAKSKIPLVYAFGAGKNALTFVTPWEETNIVELRMSYHTRLKEWFITPGQLKKEKGAELGVVWDGQTARRCVRCHTTAQPANGLFPEDKFFGVGCERCHGAGSNHVDAMHRTNKPPYYIEKRAKMGGVEMNQMCGECHRRPADVPDTEKHLTQRFQPFGLSLSKCFKYSDNYLSCVTCHNPHKDADTKPDKYNAVCLKCHTIGVTPPAKLTRVAACPRQPKGNCVQCHMPPFPVRKQQGNILIQMADHFIR